MRKRQLRFVQHEIAERDKIEVDRARQVAHRSAHASLRCLYRLQPMQEVVRLQRRLAHDDLIEEPLAAKLLRHVHRLRLAYGTGLHDARLRNGGERGKRIREPLRARLNVAA